MIDYKHKYLKYKTKYNNKKKEIYGGSVLSYSITAVSTSIVTLLLYNLYNYLNKSNINVSDYDNIKHMQELIITHNINVNNSKDFLKPYVLPRYTIEKPTDEHYKTYVFENIESLKNDEFQYTIIEDAYRFSHTLKTQQFGGSNKIYEVSELEEGATVSEAQSRRGKFVVRSQGKQQTMFDYRSVSSDHAKQIDKYISEYENERPDSLECQKQLQDLLNFNEELQENNVQLQTELYENSAIIKNFQADLQAQQEVQNNLEKEKLDNKAQIYNNKNYKQK